MNEIDIEELKKRVPEESPPFQFRSYRYYLGMWFVPVPKAATRFGKGGDMVMLMWHKLDQPSHWYCMFRVRHYKFGGTKGLWTGVDEREWWMTTITAGSDSEAKAAGDARFTAIALYRGVRKPVDYLEINGNAVKALEVVERVKPPWLHMQMTVSA